MSTCPACVHYFTATLSAVDSKPASGVDAASEFDGTALERVGARRSTKQAPGGHRGIGCDSEDRLGEVAGDTKADEFIVVTDTYEHADRLQSYERVAGIVSASKAKSNVRSRSDR